MPRKLTTEEFIEKAKQVHGDKYDYSKVEYKESHMKINILCKKYNTIFQQTPNNHLRGKGCPCCKGLLIHDKKSDTLDGFINKSIKIHGNKYTYSKVDYINALKKVCIICPYHGEFYQTPNKHLIGHGCSYCNSSHGEEQIRNYLIEHNIKFEEQKRFSDCKNKYPLPFDFYLPDYNLCIEYQGKQHFTSVKYFGGDDGLRIRKINDKIKKEYCSKINNPNLIIINYNDNIKLLLSLI